MTRLGTFFFARESFRFVRDANSHSFTRPWLRSDRDVIFDEKMDALSRTYEPLLAGSYDCLDRIVVNAYFRMGHDAGGFRLWWRKLTGSEETLDNAHLIRSNISFALVGGIAALWVRDMNLNLSASIGFIALFGMAMLNGVVFITSINQLRQEGENAHSAVLSGARRRLRPALMTPSLRASASSP